MLRRALLLLILLAPTASGLSAREAPVVIDYAVEHPPLAFATGSLSMEGTLHGGLGLVGVTGARFGPFGSLTVTETRDEGEAPSQKVLPGVTLIVHTGTVFWRFGKMEARTSGSSPYAITLTLPQTPFEVPGLLVVSPRIKGSLTSDRSDGQLLLLDATISIHDPAGRPLPGWDHQHVNQGLRVEDATSKRGVVLLEPAGPASGSFSADAFAGGVSKTTGAFALRITPAAEDGFSSTVDTLDRVAVTLGADAGAAESPLRNLEPFSGILNGAVVIVRDPSAPDAPGPVVSSIGEDELPAGPLTLLRSDAVDLGYEAGHLRVQGTSIVAFSGAGFVVDPPLVVGPLPLVSLLLWAAAIPFAVHFVMKQPPRVKPPLRHRMIALGAYGAVLAAVFVFWDLSFRATFGTSVLKELVSQGGLDDARSLMYVLALQMLPWGIAGVFFALPVRLAVGVYLRRRYKGAVHKGFAKAAGLLALAAFGPVYALWLANVVVGKALAAAGPFLLGG